MRDLVLGGGGRWCGGYGCFARFVLGLCNREGGDVGGRLEVLEGRRELVESGFQGWVRAKVWEAA